MSLAKITTTTTTSGVFVLGLDIACSNTTTTTEARKVKVKVYLIRALLVVYLSMDLSSRQPALNKKALLADSK